MRQSVPIVGLLWAIARIRPVCGSIITITPIAGSLAWTFLETTFCAFFCAFRSISVVMVRPPR